MTKRSKSKNIYENVVGCLLVFFSTFLFSFITVNSKENTDLQGHLSVAFVTALLGVVLISFLHTKNDENLTFFGFSSMISFSIILIFIIHAFIKSDFIGVVFTVMIAGLLKLYHDMDMMMILSKSENLNNQKNIARIKANNSKSRFLHNLLLMVCYLLTIIMNFISNKTKLLDEVTINSFIITTLFVVIVIFVSLFIFDFLNKKLNIRYKL